MPHPSTKPQIIAALESNARIIAEYFSAKPESVLFVGDPEHWGPGHHLIHLTRTSAAIERGLRSGQLPDHASGQSRTYAEVRDAGAASLAATPKETLLEMGRIVVLPSSTSREALVDDYVRASAELRGAASEWDEGDLDRRAMKHPLIGMMTVREMLFFCVFHERHHLKLVQQRS